MCHSARAVPIVRGGSAPVLPPSAPAPTSDLTLATHTLTHGPDTNAPRQSTGPSPSLSMCLQARVRCSVGTAPLSEVHPASHSGGRPAAPIAAAESKRRLMRTSLGESRNSATQEVHTLRAVAACCWPPYGIVQLTHAPRGSSPRGSAGLLAWPWHAHGPWLQLFSKTDGSRYRRVRFLLSQKRDGTSDPT